MELRLPLEMSPGREAACRAVFGSWGFFRTMHGKTAPSCGLHSQAGVRRGVRASGSYQEGTGKSGSYGMWNHPRGHAHDRLEKQLERQQWVLPHIPSFGLTEKERRIDHHTQCKRERDPRGERPNCRRNII